MSLPYRTFEGRRFTPTMWAAVEEWRRLATEAGVPFRITQGGWNRGAVSASAGTHDGDAIDLSVNGLTQQQVATLVETGRKVGFAAWFRTARTQWGVRAQGFSAPHIHAVPNGWGQPSPGAQAQARAYRRGRDGLKADKPDQGPGHVAAFKTRTWAAYQQLEKPQPEGELNMSDVSAILAALDYQRAQLKAIGDLVGGRAALDRDAARTAAIVKAAIDAQSRVLLQAIAQAGGRISGDDLAALQIEMRKAVADALDDAKLTIEVAA